MHYDRRQPVVKEIYLRKMTFLLISTVLLCQVDSESSGLLEEILNAQKRIFSFSCENNQFVFLIKIISKNKCNGVLAHYKEMQLSIQIKACNFK